MKFTLVPFQPAGFIESVVCHVDIDDSGESSTLSISYHLKGDLNRIKWPDESDLQDENRELWRNTCFEFFIGHESGNDYCEFNQSPSGNWAGFEFDDYRSNMKQSNAVYANEFHISRDQNECHAVLDLPAPGTSTIYLGLALVIRDVDEQLHYFGLSHPDDAPDFHVRAHHQLIALTTL
ncbi:MAG TPA: hypothetical protein DCM54_04100 [Gammaproteobacteria bacterium]|nr:hypothetical protein [Gammaproteobacteria bacterium]